MPKIFWIFGLKSSKLQRFFDNLKWTKDEDEEGSSAKNLRRTKVFDALLQHCNGTINLVHSKILTLVL